MKKVAVGNTTSMIAFSSCTITVETTRRFGWIVGRSVIHVACTRAARDLARL